VGLFYFKEKKMRTINRRLNYYVNGKTKRQTDYRLTSNKDLPPIPGEDQIEMTLEEAQKLGLIDGLGAPGIHMDPQIARTIFFDEEINEQSATQLRATLMTLAGEDKEAPIRLMLGSPGGGLYESLAIYDTIKMIPNEVVAICNGKVMSGGIVILLACDRRVSTPNTTFMMHHGHTTLQGNILELQEQINEISSLNDRMLEIIVKQTSITGQMLSDWLVKDHYLNAREAEKTGLIKRIITKLDEVDEVK
jgi:ATP-dependent Clp protease protease subunit